MSLPRQTSLTILLFGGLLLALQAGKLMRRVELAAVFDFKPRAEAVAAAPVEPVATPAPPASRYRKQGRPPMVPVRTLAVAPVQIADPAGAMRNFYQALGRAAGGEGVARVLHFGDSPVTADSITADLRTLLQQRFGDAGHGFVLIAKPWAWYNHRGVELQGSGWTIQAATQGRAKDGLHGLGGVSFEGGPGAWSEIRVGPDHTRVEVAFLRQPEGGVFEVHAGEQLLGFGDTHGELEPAWATFPIPAGARGVRIEVRSGAVRLFGASFEKSAPGLIYNSLGLNGGQVQAVVRYFDPTHWSAELQHYRPDLIVLNYGTNESLYPEYLESSYPGELRTVIRRVQKAVPEASVLVMSPMDRGERDSEGQIVTSAALPRIVEIQREVARETGCAFFNTFAAMGGAGTMARWYASEPRLVTADFIHPFPAGARKVGTLVNNAIVAGYARYGTAQSVR